MRHPDARWLLIAFAAILLSVPVWVAACGSDCDGDSCAGSGGAGATQSAGGAGGGASLAEQYCTCMLSSCHDSYHAKFGPDSNEPAAAANCLAEAESLPRAGMDVSQGNSLECRMHYCPLGKSDPSVCPNTIGEAACSDGGMGGSAGSGGTGGTGGMGVGGT